MNESIPKISVILVTYNREHYLKRAIESVLNQSFLDFELILINNGSSDGTLQLCKECAETDMRIKLINIDENRGASAGRNAGIVAASSEYITIVDDDDFCDKEMLKHMYNLVMLYDADITMCGSYNDFGNRFEPYFVFDDTIVLDKIKGLEELLKREKYNVAPPTKLFRKSLFDGLSFPDGVLVDDIHIIYKVFANADVIVASGKPLYYFTKHESNMTSFIQSNKLSPDLLREYIEMYKNRTKYLSGKVPEIERRAKYSEWSYMISMCDKIIKYKCHNCIEVYNYMIEHLNSNYSDFMNSEFTTYEERNLLRRYCKLNDFSI